MEFQKITSPQNPQIKKWYKYQHFKKYRQKDNLTLLEGLRLISEALKASPKRLKAFILSEAFLRQHPSLKSQLPQNLPFYLLPEKLFRHLSHLKTPEGIMALFSIPEQKPPKKVIKNAPCFYLHHLQNPQNLGNIIRTAAAFKIPYIFCDPTSTEVWSPKCLRAGMGGHFYTQIIENIPPETFQKYFQGQYFLLDLNGENIHQCTFPLESAFILGNEGRGFENDFTKSLPHQKITIPIWQVESLNVATCAAICAFAYRATH